MKLCIISEFTCDFSVYEAMIEGNREKVMQFCSEMTLAKVSDHKCILVADVRPSRASCPYVDPGDAAMG